MATWQRFVRVTDGEPYVERTLDGATVHECAGTLDAAPKFSRNTLSSGAAAKKSLDKRIATLRRQGYLADDAVERPIPQPEVKETLEQRHARGWAVFRARLPTFLAKWKELGFSPHVTFARACIGNRLRPSDVTARCVALAEVVFGVGFRVITSQLRSCSPGPSDRGRSTTRDFTRVTLTRRRPSSARLATSSFQSPTCSAGLLEMRQDTRTPAKRSTSPH